MKTETEKLKENRDMQYARERAEEIGVYIAHLFDESLEMGKWSLRASLLTLFCFTVWLVSVIVMLIYQVPEDILRMADDYLFLVCFLSILREHWHDRRWKYADGELEGALNALRKAGMLDDSYFGDKSKKRIKYKSKFKRFAEFWERISSKKSKEAYA